MPKENNKLRESEESQLVANLDDNPLVLMKCTSCDEIHEMKYNGHMLNKDDPSVTPEMKAKYEEFILFTCSSCKSTRSYHEEEVYALLLKRL